MILGIDISHYQYPVHFDTVRQSGIEFIIVKATEGTKYIDDTFNEYWYNIKRIGLPRAAYHYYRPLQDKLSQTKLYHSVASDTVPIVDVELYSKYLDDVNYYKSTPKELKKADLKIFLDWLESYFKIKPIIYTGYYFWKDNFSPCPWAKNYPLWLASYTDKKPLVPADWSEYVLHQFTSSGKVPGVKGNADINKTTLTYDELYELFKFEGPIKPIETAVVENKLLEVVTDRLNIRESPSTTARIVGYVSKGDTFAELDEKIIDDCAWARVGIKQWVAKIYRGNIYVIYKINT